MTSKESLNEFMMDLIVFILSMAAMYVGLTFETIGLNNQLTLFFFGIIATGISLKRMVFSVICVDTDDPVYESEE